MSKTVKLRDEDYQDQTYTVQNGVKIPLADGSGMATAYFAEGTLPITANGTYDVTDKASVAVNVPTGGGAALIGILDGTVTTLTAADLAGLTELRPSALSSLENLESVTLPEGLTVIGESAFSNDYALMSVSFPSTLVRIDSSAFEDAGLNDSGVTLGDNLAEIKISAFWGAHMPTVSIGSGLRVLWNTAFTYCADLTTFTITTLTPPTIFQEASEDIFTGCTSLTAIYVPAASVSAYKAASGWSQYASIIQAIPTL